MVRDVLGDTRQDLALGRKKTSARLNSVVDFRKQGVAVGQERRVK